ncbi:hypothetical protein WA171_004806, partial [Blastocystis sp. BT1]
MNSIESKIVVIGPPDVGKTCLSVRYVRGRFVENSITTIGASFLMKTVTSGNMSVTMKIWDTAGQEVFRSMSSLYYKDVDGAVIVFDASRPETMGVLDGWLRELNQHNAGRQFTLLLACNKMDKNAGIDKRSIEDYARSIHARVFYTSAKTGEGIDALFTEMATSIISRKRNDFIPNAPTSSSSPTTIATQAPVEEKK